MNYEILGNVTTCEIAREFKLRHELTWICMNVRDRATLPSIQIPVYFMEIRMGEYWGVSQ